MFRDGPHTLRRNGITILLVVLLYGVLIALNVPCLFMYLLHVPCPGCGMTHALLAALRLDFGEAFRCHPMFWSLPILPVLIFTNGSPTRSRTVNLWIMGLLAFGFLCSYLFRLIVYFDT